MPTIHLHWLVFALFTTAPLVARDDAGRSEQQKPPYERLLHGEDAARAALLDRYSARAEANDAYDEAVRAARALLELRSRLQGAGHPETVKQRWELDRLEKLTALPPERQAEWHRSYEKALKGQAMDAAARWREAVPLLKEYHAACTRLFGKKHPTTALAALTLAQSLQGMGDIKQAGPFFDGALQTRMDCLGADHPDTATAHNDLALNLQQQGKLAEAEDHLRRAMEVFRHALGESHPYSANAYNSLAGNLELQGRYEEARVLYAKGLQMFLGTLGEDHPNSAYAHHNLAACLVKEGRFAEAEQHFLKTLELERRILGEDHPHTARVYTSLANCRILRGTPESALPLNLKAVEICRRVLGNEHPGTATACQNLANNLINLGEYAEAERLLRECLAVRQRVSWEGRREVAACYQNLASALEGQGKFAEAQALLKKALDICRRALTEEHPVCLSVEVSLGRAMLARRKYDESEALLSRTVARLQRLQGESNSDTVLAHQLLADAQFCRGKLAEARENLLAATRGYEASRIEVARRGLDRAGFGSRLSPYRMLAVVEARQNHPLEAWIALAAELGRGLEDDLATHMESETGADVQARRRELERQDGRLRPRLLELATTKQQSVAEQEELRELLGRLRGIEQERSAMAVAASLRRVASLSEIRAVLPKDVAVLSWVDVSSGSSELEEHWVCLLKSEGDPVWVRAHGTGPNGSWTDEDSRLVQLVGEALADAGTETDRVRALANRLAAQRLAPLRTELQEVKHLFVMPVGQMASTPVCVLTDRYQLTCVPSTRELVRALTEPRPVRPAQLLALGDPLYGPPTELLVPPGGLLVTRVQAQGNAGRGGVRAGDVLLRYDTRKLNKLEDLQVQPEGSEVEVEVWRAGRVLKVRLAAGKLGLEVDRRPARDALRQRFEADQLIAKASRGGRLQALPGTRREVQAIERLFPNSDVLLGPDASEARLRQLAHDGKLRRYSHLHFAAHGQINQSRAFESALLLADADPREDAASPVAGSEAPDGLLSAREVLEGWKLDAELVVLSSCGSALGRSGGGDGLLGFGQSFLLAGARAVVLSLWPVDDTATALLMQRFYKNLLGKRAGLSHPLPTASALREAQHWLRDLDADAVAVHAQALPRGGIRVKPSAAAQTTRPFAHPHYWAAFVLIGAPD